MSKTKLSSISVSSAHKVKRSTSYKASPQVTADVKKSKVEVKMMALIQAHVAFLTVMRPAQASMKKDRRVMSALPIAAAAAVSR